MDKFSRAQIFSVCLVLFMSGASGATQTVKSTSLNWIDFNAGDGGFTIKFPGTPKVSTPEIKMGPVTLKHHAYSIDVGDFGFEAVFMDLPPGSDPDAAMAGGISNLINSAVARGSKLLGNDSVTHGNCTGREVTLSTIEPGTTKPGFLDALIFTSGLRFYNIVFSARSDTKEARDASRIFSDSFSIVGGCTSMIAPADAPREDKTDEPFEGTQDPATGWHVIESNDLGVRVLMPGAVRHVTQNQHSTQLKLTHHTFLYSNEESVYSAEVIGDYPAGWNTTPSSYQTSIDLTLYSLKKNLGAIGFEITPVRDLRLATYPGREFSLINEQRGSHGRAQIYVTPKRIYLFVAFTRSDNALTQIGRFFSTIRISPK